MNLSEALEEIEKAIEEMRERNKNVPILVEGEKDALALQSLGISGEIITIHCGKKIANLCDYIASHYKEIIILTDWDRRGWRLCKEIERNLEGVIAKKLGSKYYPGERRKEWLKIKNTKTIDVVIVGYTQEIREISALAMALWKDGKLYYIGKVGTGFDEEIMNYMLKNFEKVDSPPVVNPEDAPENVIWVKPKFVAEVEYLEMTKDNELRAPAFKRLREDKSIEECTFEQVEQR